MAYSRRHLIRLVLGLLLLAQVCASGFAQNAPGGAQQKPSRTFQVIALAPSPLLSELHHLRSATDATPLEVASSRLSKAYSTDSGTIVLGVGRKDAQGKQTFLPVAQAEWPQGGGDKALLFVAASGAGAGAKVQVVAVDNSLTAFPARSLRVINFSGRPLLGNFAGFKGELPAGPTRAVAYPRLPAAANGGVPRFQVAIGAQVVEGAAPKILFNGWTEAWPSARTLVLITPAGAPGSSRPQVRFVVDALPEEPAKVASR